MTKIKRVMGPMGEKGPAAPPEPGTYKTTVLEDKPIMYWRLGEPSGTLAADASGNGRTGTYSGGALAQTSLLSTEVDTCVSFDGLTNKVARPDEAALNFAGNQWTFETWLMPKASAVNMTYLSKVSGAYQYDAGTKATGKWYFSYQDTSEVLHTVEGGAYVKNTVYLVQVVKTATTLSLWINGVEVASTAATLPPRVKAGEYELGRYGTEAANNWNGWLDEHAVYATALSSTRLKAHLTAGGGAGGEEPPTPPLTPILWGARISGEVYSRAGDAPWDTTTYNLFVEHAGKKPTIIHWGQPFGALDITALNLAKSYGAVSLISVDFPSCSEIASGAKDSVIDAFATSCKNWGGEIILRPGWEMNGNWYAWGRNTSYVAAWQRYVTRIRAIASNVDFVWAPNIIYDTASREWLEKSWPGTAYVDWMGVDGYNKNDPWRLATAVFEGPNATYKKLGELSPGKQIMICEIAAVEAGGSKAEWITDLLATALPKNLPNIRAMVWFNWNILTEGVRLTWPIESSPAAQAAFKAGIASSYYIPGGVVEADTTPPDTTITSGP
jgi:hypothetical protein